VDAEVDTQDSGAFATADEQNLARDDFADTARRFAVNVDVLANDLPLNFAPPIVKLLELPTEGHATVQGGKIHYRPNWWKTGNVTVRYALDDAEGHRLGIATLHINVHDEPWFFVAQRLLQVETVASPAGAPLTLIDSLAGEVLLAKQTGSDFCHSFAGTIGALLPVAALGSASTCLGRSSTFWSALLFTSDGQSSSAYRTPDGTWTRVANPAEIDSFSLLGINSDGWGVGEARGPQFLDQRSHAIMAYVVGEKPFEAANIDPEGVGPLGARAFAIDDARRVAGSYYDEAGSERAFLRTALGSASIEIAGSTWSRASDLAEDWVGGTFGTADTEAVPFLSSADGHVEAFHLPNAVAGWFDALAPDGRPIGRLRAATGEVLPFRTVLVAPDEPRRFELMPEPKSGAVDHACGHAEAGPYRSLTATADPPPEAGPTLKRAHFNYVIALTEGADGMYEGYVRYDPSSAGRIVLYGTADVPVRLIRSDGAIDTPRAVARSSRCQGIAWLHEYQVNGDPYTVRIGPTPKSVVSLVYERTTLFN